MKPPTASFHASRLLLETRSVRMAHEPIEVCNCIGFRLGCPRFQVLAFFVLPMCEGVVTRQLTSQLALWIPCALCVTAGFFPTTSVETCQDALMVSGVIVSTAHWDWDWAWERIHRFRATFALLVHALCFCLSLSSKRLEC